MSLLGFVDGLLGSDLSGNKAKKYYEQGYQRQQQATQEALKTMQQYGDKAVNIYQDYMNRGMDSQTAMQQAALDSMRQGTQQGIDAYSQQYNQAQAARTPYETAGMSMLSALPYLQSALGLPAYQIPTSVQRAGLNTPALGQADVAGMLDGQPMTTAQARELGTQNTGGVGNLQLQPFNEQYNVAASPLYNWQKDEMDRDLTAQLNALGISGDTAGVAIRSRGLQGLAAQERERQVANMMGLVQGGLGVTSSMGQNEMQAGRDLSGMYGNYGMNQANLLSQAGNQRGMMLGSMGENLAGYNLGMGANQANALLAGGQSAMNMGISQAQQPNAMNQLINTGIGLWGAGMFGNKQLPRAKSTQPAITPYNQPGYAGASFGFNF